MLSAMRGARKKVFTERGAPCGQKEMPHLQWQVAGQLGDEVVGECDAGSTGDFVHLVLAVRVEGAPLQQRFSRHRLKGVVKFVHYTIVLHSQRPSCVNAGKHNHQGAKLQPAHAHLSVDHDVMW